MTTYAHAKMGLAMAAITMFLTLPAFGQGLGHSQGSDGVKPPSTIKVGNRALQRTAFQLASGNIVTGCNTNFCLSTPTPLFVRTAQCDGAAGKTCTLYLHLDAQIAISTSDDALIKFLVDGVPPNPGPTGLNGLVTVGGGVGDYQTRSFSVVAYVTNTTANQQHNIEIDLVCEELNGDGDCLEQADLATLQAVVYTP